MIGKGSETAHVRFHFMFFLGGQVTVSLDTGKSGCVIRTDLIAVV